jgi:predicted amidophosphoribosyltransferase
MGVWEKTGRWRPTMRWRTAATWRRAVRLLEFLIQAVTDFLIEDLCALCGAGPSPSSGQDPSADDATVNIDGAPTPTRCLTQPVEHRYLARFVITNHPICRECLGRFEPALRRGVLGVIVDRDIVVTTRGDRFEPAGERRGGRTPRDTEPAERKRGGAQPLSVIAPFMINDNALKLVHLVKFSRHVELTVPMGMAMARAYALFGGQGDGGSVVVPTPMEHGEHRRRGFSQTQRLAGVFARELGLPVLDDLLVKTVRTARQSKTAPDKRAENVRGAFFCTPGGARGKPVILVDDLVTTGATAAACATELLASGARLVEVLCFARAL